LRRRGTPLRRTLLALAAAGVAAAGAGAGAAQAATYTLNLSGPPSATAGSPVLITASGIAPPPAEYWNAFWIEIVAIPGSVTTTCPSTGQEGLGVATGTGGGIVEISMHPNQELSGAFSNQTGFTPLRPGALLVCAYSVDGAGNTFARAALLVDVQGANVGPVAQQERQPARRTHGRRHGRHGKHRRPALSLRTAMR